MAISLAALGLLAFLLGCSGTFADSDLAAKCSLTGTWKSALGNTMEINSVNDTVFSGFFHIGPVPYPLLGIQNQGPQPTFVFTVTKDYHEFTALFEGQCLVDENGKEQLKTIWLLLEKVGSAAKDWGPIRYGRSIFHRIK